MTPQEFLALYGIWYLDNPLSKKYELTGASVVFDKDVGIVVTVLRADGSPKIGDGSLFICNIFPDGNGDVPVQPNGSGVGSFQGAASSAYTPPQRGPFTITLF